MLVLHAHHDSCYVHSVPIDYALVVFDFFVEVVKLFLAFKLIVKIQFRCRCWIVYFVSNLTPWFLLSWSRLLSIFESKQLHHCLVGFIIFLWLILLLLDVGLLWLWWTYAHSAHLIVYLLSIMNRSLICYRLWLSLRCNLI